MRIITHCIDIIFPPRPDERTLRNIAQLPYQQDRWQGVIYLHNFKQPEIKAAITENKYQNNRQAQKLLAHSVKVWCQRQVGQLVFIPVPLSKKREKERGYNQVTNILKIVAEPNFTLLNTAVERTRHTQPQTSLNKQERTKNVQNAFTVSECKNINELKNTTVVLVDDVVTTGATLEACARPLREKLDPSSQLILLALAH